MLIYPLPRLATKENVLAVVRIDQQRFLIAAGGLDLDLKNGQDRPQLELNCGQSVCVAAVHFAWLEPRVKTTSVKMTRIG